MGFFILFVLLGIEEINNGCFLHVAPQLFDVIDRAGNVQDAIFGVTRLDGYLLLPVGADVDG